MSSMYDTKTYNSLNMVKCGLIEVRKIFREFALEKNTRTYLPAGVNTGSFVEKVGGNFVRI